MPFKKGDIAVDVADKTKVIEFDGANWNLLVHMNTGVGQEALDHDTQIAALFGAAKEMQSTLKEVVLDLFLQIEGKHGPQKASSYPSIVKARTILEKIK